MVDEASPAELEMVGEAFPAVLKTSASGSTLVPGLPRKVVNHFAPFFLIPEMSSSFPQCRNSGRRRRILLGEVGAPFSALSRRLFCRCWRSFIGFLSLPLRAHCRGHFRHTVTAVDALKQVFLASFVLAELCTSKRRTGENTGSYLILKEKEF